MARPPVTFPPKRPRLFTDRLHLARSLLTSGLYTSGETVRGEANGRAIRTGTLVWSSTVSPGAADRSSVWAREDPHGRSAQRPGRPGERGRREDAHRRGRDVPRGAVL